MGRGRLGEIPQRRSRNVKNNTCHHRNIRNNEENGIWAVAASTRIPMKTMIGFHKKGRAEGYSIKAVSTSVEMELFGALAIAEPSSSLHLKPSMEHENRRLREMYKISIKIQN